MSVTADQSQPAGENPRTTRVRRIIVDAAMDLLIGEGASAVTAARIAERTGVARTTIYRHWPTPAALLTGAIDQIVSPHITTSISANLEQDLITALSNLQKRMIRKPFRAVFAALLDHANRNIKSVAVQRRFVNGVLQPVRDILSAARERGDLPSALDIESASAQLAGPVFLQHVMLRAPVSDRLIAQSISQFLRGCRDGD